jgi:hypothetical protein
MYNTLVLYPGPLNFSRVMPIWTWIFDTIHCALCHHNSSHMLNEMFVKLSILQHPNMKMCILVAYPDPLNFSRVIPKTMQNVQVQYRNNISWRSISPISKPYFVKKSSNGELLCLNAHNCTLESLELYPKLCTFTSLDSNVQLCAFKHRSSPFELFFTKYGFDIGLMDLHEHYMT